jgi:hypothetical protein
VHDTHQGHDNTPCDHDRGKPDGGSDLLEHEVAGHFESGVGEEEGSQTPVVLIVGEFQVFLESFDLGVADVPTCADIVRDRRPSSEEGVEAYGRGKRGGKAERAWE